MTPALGIRAPSRAQAAPDRLAGDEESRLRALHYMERVGLEALAHRRPKALSGGQQQRVAVARALAAGPRLVLADEPTANLDSETAQGLLELMGELNEEEGMTFLFSTHDVRVMERARRVITWPETSAIETPP